MNTALTNRANIAVGRELVERGFDKTLGQINNLLKNPTVQKHPKVVAQLQIATRLKADKLKPFDSALRRMDDFLAANKSKLANLTKQARALGAVDAVTGQHVSNALNGVVGTAVTLAEAAVTGDTAGLEALAQKSQSGDYGIFLQAGTAAGNAIASLGDPNARERFVQDAASGKYGVVGQFGNALGEGLGRLFFGGD